MISRLRHFCDEHLITHGPWQFPVRVFALLQKTFSKFSSMSQVGQDQVVLDLLKHKQHGVFVELGASNGVTSSNTYILEKKYKWTGLCIEANKKFYKNLIKNRSCKTVFSCVAGSEKDVLFNNDGATGKMDSAGVAMRAQSLGAILDSQDMPRIIDYLSLDVEGAEEEIILNFPFDRYRFNVMSIERPTQVLDEFLIKLGYEFHKNLPSDENILDKVYVFGQR